MSDPVDFRIVHQATPGQCDVIHIIARDGPTTLVTFEMSPADFLGAIMGHTVIAALTNTAPTKIAGGE